MTTFLFKCVLAAVSVAMTWLLIKKVQQARRIYFFHDEA